MDGIKGEYRLRVWGSRHHTEWETKSKTYNIKSVGGFFCLFLFMLVNTLSKKFYLSHISFRCLSSINHVVTAAACWILSHQMRGLKSIYLIEESSDSRCTLFIRWMFLVLLAAMMLDLGGPDRYWMALDSSLQTRSSNDVGKRRTADVVSCY